MDDFRGGRSPSPHAGSVQRGADRLSVEVYWGDAGKKVGLSIMTLIEIDDDDLTAREAADGT